MRDDHFRDRRPTFSIIIDSYNQVDFLARAIESALGQTNQDVEVVVVDDGSTDGSQQILRAHQDKIRMVLKKNGGQGSALNAGFAASTGRFVSFLDADDLLDRDFVERALDLLRSTPAPTMVQFRMRVIDAGDQPTGDFVPPRHVAMATGDMARAVRSWRLASGFAPTSGLAFPRYVLQQLFPLPEAILQYGGDFPLVRGAALLGPIVSADRPVVSYRSHAHNNSNGSSLNLAKLRRSMIRQVQCFEYLSQIAELHGRGQVQDPLQSRDPVFLSQRIASLRADPVGHPFSTDRRLRLVRAGVVTGLARDDIGVVARIVHAGWFLLMAVLPRRPATTLARLLIRPMSRGSLLARALDLLGRARR